MANYENIVTGLRQVSEKFTNELSEVRNSYQTGKLTEEEFTHIASNIYSRLNDLNNYCSDYLEYYGAADTLPDYLYFLHDFENDKIHEISEEFIQRKIPYTEYCEEMMDAYRRKMFVEELLYM